MVGFPHEFFLELFRERPVLVAELLHLSFKFDVPVFDRVQASPNDLTDLDPAEYRADSVVTLYRGDTPVLGIIVESQTTYDPEKLRTWPAYAATLHRRLGCLVMLVVICPDPAVADRYDQPIRFGIEALLVPWVLRMGRVPVVDDPDRARDNPQLAVLSAAAHGTHPNRERIFQAMRPALELVAEGNTKLYADVVLSMVPEDFRAYVEAILATRTYEYQSDFARRYYAEGEAEGEARGLAEGRAEALLTYLAMRRVAVPGDAHARITGCTDLERLDTWLRRAFAAESITSVYDLLG